MKQVAMPTANMRLALVCAVAVAIAAVAIALMPWAALAVEPAAAQAQEDPGIEIGPDPDVPPPPKTPVPPREAADVEQAKEDVEKAREEVEQARRQAEEVLRAEQALRDVEEKLKRERVIKRRADADHVVLGDRGEIVRMGQDVDIEEGETVEEVVVIGGDLTVRGDVSGDAVAVGGDVRVVSTGRVMGDAVSIGGNLMVEDGGIVDGNEVEVGNIGPLFLPGFGRTYVHGNGPGVFIRIVKSVLTLLVILFIGWLAMVLFGNRLTSLADTVQNDFWRSLLVGVLVLVLWLPAVFLSAITVIGIPVAVLLVIGVPLALFVGYLIGALAFGRRLVAGIRLDRESPLLHLLAGLTAIGLLGFFGRLLGIVDILGPVAVAFRIVSYALLCFAAILGIGALTTVQVEAIRARRSGTPPVTPPPGEPSPPPPPPGPEGGSGPGGYRGKLVWEPSSGGERV